MKSRKTISVLLALICVMTMLCSFGPFAIAVTNEKNRFVHQNVENNEFVSPDIISFEEKAEHNYVDRSRSDEKDLNTFVFENADGSKTMRVFSHPVKFYNSDGTIEDISLCLDKKEEGFVPIAHMVDTVFPEKIDKGITLRYNDVDIEMYPNVSTTETSLSKDGKSVSYVVDNATKYVYSLTYSGYKEEIVVNEYTGQTDFDFFVETNGLIIKEENNKYVFVDKNDAVKAYVSDVIVFTADEANNFLGKLTVEKIVESEEYKINIHIDKEDLQDEKTIYPIRIDPTISVKYDTNGAGAIEDVTINQYATFSGGLGSLYVGRHPAGSLSRTLMRFPNLSLQGISGCTVTSAYVELRDLMCQGNEDINIECWSYSSTAPVWTESGTTTWSSVGSNYLSSFLDSKTISYGNGYNGSQSYRFDLSSIVNIWKSGGSSPSTGLVFKAESAFENQTGSSVKYWYKTFSSYNRDCYQPSITIVYNNSSDNLRNPYYSVYNSSKYYSADVASGTYTTAARYRMNCYGYALGHILDGGITVSSGDGFKQQPGDFAQTNELANVVNPDPNISLSRYMNDLVHNMQIDARRLGYTIEEYVPTGSVLPQFGYASDGCRLIALVVQRHYTGITNQSVGDLSRSEPGEGKLYEADYHFYVQNNAGAANGAACWSHKPGSDNVTNLSLTSGVVLTNSNIKTKATEGQYAGGQLKFFLITRPAIQDHPHSSYDGTTTPRGYPTTLYKDVAGDVIQTSRLITQPESIQAKIDHPKDDDFFCFIAPTTRTYTIKTNCQTSSQDLDAYIYNSSGSLMSTITNAGDVNTTMNLSAGTVIYIKVFNYSSNSASYVFQIT